MNQIILDDIERLCEKDIPWDLLKDKKILITGGRGGMSTYIILLLLELNRTRNLGISVIAMCRDEEKSRRWFADCISNPYFSLFIHDVVEPFEDVDFCADVILHMTNVKGVFSAGRKNNPYSIFENNVMGFHNVINAARRWKSEKVIIFSSAAVYGSKTSKEDDESYRGIVDFDDVDNIYRISKQMVECMAYTMYEQYRIDIRVIRPYNVYGPLLGGASKGNHMTDFIRDYIIGKEIIINGDGEARRAYCYVADAIDAILRIWLLGDSRPYNISGSNIRSIKEFADIVSAHGEKKIQVSVHVNHSTCTSPVSVYAGSDKRIKELGWQESYSLADGIGRTIEWAQESMFMFE